MKTQKTVQANNLANVRASDARAALIIWDLSKYQETGRLFNVSEVGKILGDVVNAGINLGNSLSEIKRKNDEAKAAAKAKAKATYQFNTNTNSWERREAK